LPKLESLNNALEKAVIISGNMLESRQSRGDFPKPGAPVLPYLDISGTIRLFECQWLHIRLNTLLPHCRFQTPAYISDTITRLLDRFAEQEDGLPYYGKAMLIIDEHCDLKSRNVFDQDNKGFKAIPNALKGRVFQDDDQFTLGIALVSTLDDTPACDIYVIPAEDAADFFALRAEGYL